MLRPAAALVVAAALLAPAGARADLAARRTPTVLAVEKTKAAVVSISTDQKVRVQVGGSHWLNEFFGGYYQPPRYKEGYRPYALGSGVIIDPRGYVVTNYHVIRHGARIWVHLWNDKRLRAQVVGTDPDGDLAVLKVDAGKPLPAAPLGDSNTLMLGETVIAIGNPFGLAHTVSRGIVSSLHRDLKAEGRTYFDFIQTDASINPGNSGGPLLDIDGEVMGINTAILGKGQGIGFAIPAARVKREVADLIHFGHIREAWLGLLVQPVQNDRGVVVTDVLRGSPAAGKVKQGDVILGIDGRPVGSSAEYRYRLRAVTVGAVAHLKVVRGEGTVKLSVKTTEVPAHVADELLRTQVGITVRANGRRLARRMRLATDWGLVVTRVTPGSPAARVGLKPGDVIRAVNSVEVTGHSDLKEMVLRAERSGQLELVIQRGGYLQELTFPL